ncbi:unnamed protein product [Kuraishia capsulata CBS 1993]|uniref:Fork-head domain-containing protein n=1 Tax=Kuraishia capsulata CBS 1993 TaxID=1382522 RepID=W6MG96_9ASCO|nr:uncharacterized protein KUCA_T00001016001 [Kuraishia capsulata CBS 1993]CDK25049.1 unnamed protein product [Kuraishia capsulata CBS 1993]
MHSASNILRSLNSVHLPTYSLPPQVSMNPPSTPPEADEADPITPTIVIRSPDQHLGINQSYKESSLKKQKKAKGPIMDFQIPPPEELPVIYDEPDHKKPPYSYATLIGMAILRSEERKLTLSQIYGWISQTFRYYKKEDVGWQNSIRHNLSLNKAFTKTEKSKDGKGHFWKIETGYEHIFLKNKASSKRKIDDANGPMNETKPSLLPPLPRAHIDESPIPVKRYKPSDIKIGNGELLNIPSLGAPSPNWRMSNDHQPQMIFKSTSEFSSTTTIFDSPRPLYGNANREFTSSFSCNFELSPVKVKETGPLLEPITPARQFRQSTNLTKTPNSVKKLWNSPSYLDDFYTSPVNDGSPRKKVTDLFGFFNRKENDI